jgi:hypothetical protein
MSETLMLEIIERVEKRLDSLDNKLCEMQGCVSDLRQWRGWIMGGLAGLSVIGFLTGAISLVAVLTN